MSKSAEEQTQGVLKEMSEQLDQDRKKLQILQHVKRTLSQKNNGLNEEQIEQARALVVQATNGLKGIQQQFKSSVQYGLHDNSNQLFSQSKANIQDQSKAKTQDQSKEEEQRLGFKHG